MSIHPFVDTYVKGLLECMSYCTEMATVQWEIKMATHVQPSLNHGLRASVTALCPELTAEEVHVWTAEHLLDAEAHPISALFTGLQIPSFTVTVWKQQRMLWSLTFERKGLSQKFKVEARNASGAPRSIRGSRLIQTVLQRICTIYNAPFMRFSDLMTAAVDEVLEEEEEAGEAGEEEGEFEWV